MRVQTRSSFVPSAFGFVVLALLLATADCRFNRAKAQEEEEEGLVYYRKFCTEAVLRETWGDDWHIGYMLNGCWMYEPTYGPMATNSTAKPARPIRFAVRGR